MHFVFIFVCFIFIYIIKYFVQMNEKFRINFLDKYSIKKKNIWVLSQYKQQFI